MSWEIEDIVDGGNHTYQVDAEGTYVFFTPTEGSLGEVEVHIDDVGLEDDGIVYNGVLDIRDPDDYLEFVERLSKRFPHIDWTEPLDILRRSVKHTGPRAMTLAEVYDEGPAQTQWACEGVVALGAVSILVAHPKAGKTQLALCLSRAGLTGDQFIGREVQLRSVIYCTEQGLTTIRDQLHRGGLGREIEHFRLVPLVDMYQLSWPKRVRYIESILEDLPGPCLVVIDTLAEWVGVRENQENDTGAMREAMSQLQHLAQSTNVAVLVLHHAKKGAESDRPQALLRGSSSIAASADILLGLAFPSHRPAKGRRTRKLTGEGRFGDEIPHQIFIEWSEDGLTYALQGESGKTEVLEADRVAQATAGVLADGELHELAELMEKTGATRSTLQRVLEGLSGVIREGEGTRRSPYAYRRQENDGSDDAPSDVSAQTPMKGGGALGTNLGQEPDGHPPTSAQSPSPYESSLGTSAEELLVLPVEVDYPASAWEVG